VILRKGRFAMIAGLVGLAAFLLGFGTLLTGAQPAQRPRGAVPAGAAGTAATMAASR